MQKQQQPCDVLRTTEGVRGTLILVRYTPPSPSMLVSLNTSISYGLLSGASRKKLQSDRFIYHAKPKIAIQEREPHVTVILNTHTHTQKSKGIDGLGEESLNSAAH